MKFVCEGDRAFSEASAVSALPRALNLNRNLITLYPKRKTHFFDAAMIYTNNCRTVNIAACIFALSTPMNLVLGADGPSLAAGRGICLQPGHRASPEAPLQSCTLRKAPETDLSLRKAILPGRSYMNDVTLC